MTAGLILSSAIGAALVLAAVCLWLRSRLVRVRQIAQDLHRSEARFRALTEMSADWYWEQDEQFRLSYVSEGYDQMSIALRSSMLGSIRWERPGTTPLSGTWADHRAVLEAHLPFKDFEYTRIADDGRQVIISLSGEPVFDAAGRFSGYRGVGRNITERKLAGLELQGAKDRIERMNAELEERVRLRTTELEALVKELEMFNYAVAHDLRTSLGVMSVNAGMLLIDLKDRLGEESRRALERIAGNAELAAKLLEDLQAYSQLMLDTVGHKPVAMGPLAQGAWRRLWRAESGREVVFEAAELPDCVGDERMLAQLWTSLISNALKFTSTRAQARIEVGYSTTESAYFVRDNGVGFDMQHAQKLFGMFERLHRDERFEGTGVGLALAARIVRRHRGRIWADARPEEGAIFYFTIP